MASTPFGPTASSRRHQVSPPHPTSYSGSQGTGMARHPLVQAGGLLTLLLLALTLMGSEATPLDDYVNRYDPNYRYDVIDQYRGPDYTLYTINMTSQRWQTEAVVDKPLWWHYMTITVPDKVLYPSNAFMLIDGGSNHDQPPKVTDTFVELTTMMAVSTNSIGADLKMIPNQPLTFKADPQLKQRSEDAIIAWTWKTFVEVNSSDPEFLLRMPMSKASVRGLDTIADFAKKLLGYNVNKFYIAGASKRGWTTWTTAAVDQRVVAMSPIVMDLLHMVKNLHHHFKAYGGWTFAFKDYYDLDFTKDLDNPNVQKMADVIDPISYNSRLTIPKLIISTGGDEFFLPDDSHYYFDELTPPKYLRILPNAEHSCAGHETSLLFTMRAFYLSVVTGTALPKLSWVREQTRTGARITVTADRHPLTVTTFYARTLDKKRRDFRLLIGSPNDPTKPYPHPIVWHADIPRDLGNNSYVAEFDEPEDCWLAFFIQLTFASVNGSVLEFTTETEIIPYNFPFPDCVAEGCTGNLV